MNPTVSKIQMSAFLWVQEHARKLKTAMAAVMATVMTMTMAVMPVHADTLDTIGQKLTATFQSTFSVVTKIAVPVCALGMLICLIAIAFSVFTGNSKGINGWKNSLIVLGVVLVLVFIVPTLVQWFGQFGKEVNGTTTLQDVQTALTQS